MSSWEEIANEVAPPGQAPGGLATGARRKERGGAGLGPSLAQALGASRLLECPPARSGAGADEVWGGRAQDGPHGAYYLIERAVAAYDEGNADLASRLARALRRPPTRAFEGLELDDLLFCDIETLGLSAAEPLFLIGTLGFRDGQAILRLLLARQRSEEKAVLGAFSTLLPGRTLVTFNGKSFDWPFIQGRATRNLVRLPSPAGHVDLLFAARRRYRSQLPNCRLQTLEMGVCGRGRKGDIPSSRIPERYLDFLELADSPGGGAHLLAPILFHNALDVLTMAELICCMSESDAPPSASASA